MDVNNIKKKILDLQLMRKDRCTTNQDKRMLYAETELLIMDIDDMISLGKVESEQLNTPKEELAALSESLSLAFVKRPGSYLVKIIRKIDEMMRLIAVWLILAASAIVFAFPCILLAPLDYILVSSGILSVFHQVSVQSKLFISRCIIIVSGTHVVHEVEGHGGDVYKNFGKQCVLTCFSHASSMDAFLITATIPVTALTVCKSELFLIPYFSWCLTAFGGVAIKRGDRDQAVKALSAAAGAAGGGDCIAIAPEGTRSKSGQLMEFKKGPFHIWEQLDVPIVPIVTLGAFELYPPGCQMSLPGKVYVRFLEPILPSEAKSREDMSRLLRRRMLNSFKNCPNDVATDLTWSQRLYCWLHMLGIYGFWYALYTHVPYRSIIDYFHVSVLQAWGLVLAFSVLVTLTLFFYAVHIAPVLRKLMSRKDLSSKKSDKKD
mmetsp:Transcript_17383/g.29150  ORF Transcript_17383/g.29150 Transcript_17383/m.29150 type:complete len:433 (+) Transcript_17383:116-1414(+)